MQSHLDVKINGRSLTLEDGFGLDIEERNPMFYQNEMNSWPVPVPLNRNRQLLGDIDNPKSDVSLKALEQAPVSIIVEGMPFKSGYVNVQEGVEVTDALSVNVDNGKRSLEDLIGDLQCQDVPLKDRIQIGEKIGNVRVSVDYEYTVKVVYPDKKGTDEEVEHTATDHVEGEFEPQALGFSYPGICEVESEATQVARKKGEQAYKNGETVIEPQETVSFINVTDAYPYKPYCNARIAYKHIGIKEDGTSSGELVSVEDTDLNAPEERYPYWMLDAKRPQSGICFYVRYFLDCLFTYLGVSYDLSALDAVEDLNHLCFFTTHCKYTTEIAHGSEETPFFHNVSAHDYTKPQGIILNINNKEKTAKIVKWNTYAEDRFNEDLFTDINNWLRSRGCGGELSIPWPETKQVQDFFYRKNGGEQRKIVVGADDVQGINIDAKITRGEVSANILSMWATSDNFPEESVKTVLDSLEASFGIKFNYDYEQNKVTAYLMRDVFRSQEAPIDLLGNVLSMTRVTEKVMGVRMRYSAESDSKEQRQNVKKGVKNYDTDYDYIDYRPDTLVTDLDYKQITEEKPVENLKTYIDLHTGNAYRWKASEDALESGEYKCSLFEVGTFKGVELGDCSERYEDFIKEFTSSFVPVPFNDVNYRMRDIYVAAGTSVASYTYQGDTYEISRINSESDMSHILLSAYIDEEMEHEFVEQFINNALPSTYANLYLTERLKMRESYDPTKTDDGNSPLQHYDWGLAIALMQGGGTDGYMQIYDTNYDLLGNSRWRNVAGEYALTSDSMSPMGVVYDYNGDRGGLGGGERFSLKISAVKPFLYYIDAGGACHITKDLTQEGKDVGDGQHVWLAPCYADETSQGEVTKKIRTRGLYETFMLEYTRFLLERKTFKVRLEASIAMLANITNHWHRRWRIDGMVGWIGKVKYNIDVQTGINNVELEFFTI